MGQEQQSRIHTPTDPYTHTEAHTHTYAHTEQQTPNRKGHMAHWSQTKGI